MSIIAPGQPIAAAQLQCARQSPESMRVFFVATLILSIAFAATANWMLRRGGWKAVWVFGGVTALAVWGLSLLWPYYEHYYRGQLSSRSPIVAVAYGFISATLVTHVLSHPRVPSYLRVLVAALVSWAIADAGWTMV